MMVDAVGIQLIPLYRIVGPVAIAIMLKSQETVVGNFEPEENENMIPWRSWNRALYAPVARVEVDSAEPNRKE